MLPLLFKSPAYGFQRDVDGAAWLARNIPEAVVNVLCRGDFFPAFELVTAEVAEVAVAPVFAVDTLVEASPLGVEVVKAWFFSISSSRGCSKRPRNKGMPVRT